MVVSILRVRVGVISSDENNSIEQLGYHSNGLSRMSSNLSVETNIIGVMDNIQIPNSSTVAYKTATYINSYNLTSCHQDPNTTGQPSSALVSPFQQTIDYDQPRP